MSTITVRIDSSRPIFIEADADSFGQIFAGLNDDEQVNVLRSMVEHMKPHRMQWDYIAIALEKDENRDVRDDLSVIFPAQHELLSSLAAKDAEIAKLREDNARLREALEPFSTFAGAVFSRNFNSHDDVMELDPGNGDWVALSAGDFFEARRALAKEPTP